MSTATIHVGDCREVLRSLPARSVQTVVTSPPYWGLRAYLDEADAAKASEIGLERTPEEWVRKIVDVFRDVRRVLRDDGTAWVNLGDCFYGPKNFSGTFESTDGVFDRRRTRLGILSGAKNCGPHPTIKEKDLVGQAWMAALALRDDGWYLRADIVWAKPNPMPESITDRLTRAHEFVFLLAKRPCYFFDHIAIKEPCVGPAEDNTAEDHARAFSRKRKASAQPRQGLAKPRTRTYATDAQGRHDGLGRSNIPWDPAPTRNKRDVWTIPPKPFRDAHFATYPPALVEPCILAGTSAHGCCSVCGAPWGRVLSAASGGSIGESWHDHADDLVRGQRKGGNANDGTYRPPETLGWAASCECATGLLASAERPRVVPCTVLDPFNGAGTTGLVAAQLGRSYIGVELKREYAEMAQARIQRAGHTVLIAEAAHA